ncbi:MAG: sulfur carrier protein ThiS [Bacillota bacterium]|nr:sulfur carrier protein ThiS [Bacillota bacterium]
MIKINNIPYEWKEELTVANLLEIIKDDSNFKYLINPATTVAINKNIIFREEYEKLVIRDGDDIQIVFMFQGG